MPRWRKCLRSFQWSHTPGQFGFVLTPMKPSGVEIWTSVKLIILVSIALTKPELPIPAGATDAAEPGNPACTPRCQSTSTGSAEKSEKTPQGQADETETLDWNRSNPTANTAPRSFLLYMWAIIQATRRQFSVKEEETMVFICSGDVQGLQLLLIRRKYNARLMQRNSVCLHFLCLSSRTSCSRWDIMASEPLPLSL